MCERRVLDPPCVRVGIVPGILYRRSRDGLDLLLERLRRSACSFIAQLHRAPKCNALRFGQNNLADSFTFSHAVTLIYFSTPSIITLNLWPAAAVLSYQIVPSIYEAGPLVLGSESAPSSLNVHWCPLPSLSETNPIFPAAWNVASSPDTPQMDFTEPVM